MPIAGDGDGLDVTKGGVRQFWTYCTPARLRSPHLLRYDRSTFALKRVDRSVRGSRPCIGGSSSTLSLTSPRPCVRSGRPVAPAVAAPLRRAGFDRVSAVPGELVHRWSVDDFLRTWRCAAGARFSQA